MNASYNSRPCSHNITTLTTIQDGKPRLLQTARGTTSSIIFKAEPLSYG
jgi:hypothetical protein